MGWLNCRGSGVVEMAVAAVVGWGLGVAGERAVTMGRLSSVGCRRPPHLLTCRNTIQRQAGTG